MMSMQCPFMNNVKDQASNQAQWHATTENYTKQNVSRNFRVHNLILHSPQSMLYIHLER